MKIDLHNHTIHSDGILSEEELVKRAKLNGVDIFALTDHDSTYGCENIIKYGEKYGVKVIKGMELSTDYYGESIHIVCLFKDNIIPEKILNFSRDFKEKRKLRAIKMIELIHEYYGLKYDLDLLFTLLTMLIASLYLMKTSQSSSFKYLSILDNFPSF